MLLFMTLAVYLVQQNAYHFQASVIPTTQAPPYDGLSMPILKAPNWVALTSSERSLTYSQLPTSKIMNIPVYDPIKLKTPMDTLKWGNAAHEAIINMKVTYSVPYMGNYTLDNIEYAGGHLAVDIKIPTGTPVFAIGNGIVTKTQELSSGFGNHLVIEHKNFPSYENENIKTTYYSSYSHLSQILVTEGKVVKRGELIGYSGASGLATTPHLHFQIDKSTAPWHPYWHFTTKEASDAGFNFTQAINAGFNKDVALANTINPITYIQKYNGVTVAADTTTTSQTTSTSSSTSTTSTTTTTTSSSSSSSTGTTSTGANTSTASSSNLPATEGYVYFDIRGDNSFIPGEKIEITIIAQDRKGNLIKDYVPPSPVRFDKMQGGFVFTNNKLYAKDFINGVATITITPQNENPIQFMVATDTVMVESQIMYPGVFVDISKAHPNFQAISFLQREGVIAGYSDGSFRPDQKISRVEVLKLILEGIKVDLDNVRNLPYTDTDVSAWYAKYLATAVNLEIVAGYPDKTFRPNETVNKVEFLKMLVEAMNVDINPEVSEFIYTDIDEKAWYAPYVQFAIEKNIFTIEGTKFNPIQQMQRADVAEAIYRIQLIAKTGAKAFTADLHEQAIAGIY